VVAARTEDPNASVGSTRVGAVARWVSLVALTLAVVAVATLHAVRTEMSPVSTRLSQYADGPHAWLMTCAFWAAGLGVVALAVALAAWRRGRVARLVAGIAAGAGVGLALSGVFPTGVAPSTELVHSRASAAAVVGLTGLAVLWSLRSPVPADRAWPQAPLAGAAAAALLVSPLLHDTVWTGLSQRTLWTLVTAWLLTAARRLPAGAAQPGTPRDTP
jgi:hypothetical protein